MTSNPVPEKKAQVYDASDSPTIQHFLTDMTTPFCGIMSHVNSGKTSAMCIKSLLIAKNQHPDVNGVRYTRHLFVRGTAGDILRGTVKTFTQWIDEKLINLRRSTPIQGHLEMKALQDQKQRFPRHMFFTLDTGERKQFPYYIGAKWDPRLEIFTGGQDVSGQLIGDVFPNGTFVDAEFHFVPLDNPDWESTLLGTEYTCGNLDEPDSMANIADVMTKVPSRTGRYPSIAVAPITCDQINASFNPAPRDSFMEQFFSPQNEKFGRKLYRIPPPYLIIPDREEPDNYFKADFVKNPDAEGVAFSATGFRIWKEIIDANRHDPNKIRRDVLGEWTRGSGGALIHPEYNRRVHVAQGLKAQRQLKLFCSLDPGFTGACVFAQMNKGGLKVIKEIGAEGLPTHEFITDVILPELRSTFRGFETIVTGDPTGRYRNRDTGDSPFALFADQGYLVEDDTAIDPQKRWSAVNMLLKFKDGLLIDEDCTELIKGFEGGYTFKVNRSGKNTGQADKTNPLSAYQDCLQAIACLVSDGYEAGAVLDGDPYRKSYIQGARAQSNFIWV